MKELELTEGRATGIPTILKTLHDNGSPAPRFNTDDDRTFFEVELLIHAAFAEKTPIKFDLETVQWNLQGIDNLLNLLVESVFGDIAGNQADWVQTAEIQAKEAFELLDSNQVSTIAGGIAGGIAEKQIAILKQCRKPKIREDVLSAIKLSNQRKNYVDYMLPLVPSLHGLVKVGKKINFTWFNN